jgi:hypothetical protein
MDWRSVETGHEIPSENYCDQPYVVITDKGYWLCVLTTGTGLESKPGQHVVAAISKDNGKTWSDLIDIEPVGEKMTSWVTAFKVPSGRVYAVYNYQMTTKSTQHGGWFCFKYSDDEGYTWNDERIRIPIRKTKKDRENVTLGQEQFFWCIDKPVVTEKGVYLGIAKLYSGVPIAGSESWVIFSENILSESNPDKIIWKLLPEGDDGIYNPELGSIQEEQNLEVLSNGTLYMIMRTEIGVIGYTVSKDDGRSWSIPQPVKYPDGRALRNPRACPKIGKTKSGKFLLWFHNNGFPGWGNSAVRNPVWISGGIENKGNIKWSQPEIILYASDPTVRGMSYPDYIEQDGKLWITETEKSTARVHPIDNDFLSDLWLQCESTSSRIAQKGLIYENNSLLKSCDKFEISKLPSLLTGGFSVEMLAETTVMSRKQPILSSYGNKQQGFCISVSESGALEIEIQDGRIRRWVDFTDGLNPEKNLNFHNAWKLSTQPGIVELGKMFHVVFIVDGLANVVSVLVNGLLLDGGQNRIQGWSRLNPWLDDINDAEVCTVGNDFSGKIEMVRIYDRYLRTSEAVLNYRACSGIK